MARNERSRPGGGGSAASFGKCDAAGNSRKPVEVKPPAPREHHDESDAPLVGALDREPVEPVSRDDQPPQSQPQAQTCGACGRPGQPPTAIGKPPSDLIIKTFAGRLICRERQTVATLDRAARRGARS